MSSEPPSLVTRLRREKTRPKTSFSSSERVRVWRVGWGAEVVVVGAVEEDVGREGGGVVQRRE